MGYSLHTKTNPSLKHAATCRSPHFDQHPIPNRLPQSQFLSDLDRSNVKIYLPPLTNVFQCHTKMNLLTNHFELPTLTGHIILGRILSCHLIFHGVTL